MQPSMESSSPTYKSLSFMNQEREYGVKKLYINRPCENQNMKQCYAGQISIKENFHFIIEAEEVEHYCVGTISS